ncbi:protein moonraker isoform X2 [Rhinatrema bivittatum]|uniref:protein moonraker isoform X2 n=1 Tax=Rhinatrema bivittatum TaxID=194408 RepID=UPI0011279664|nr:protein moonraker isoform X2 [Rhinatrema bivittatum]
MAVDFQYQSTLSNVKDARILNTSYGQLVPGTKLDKNSHLGNPPRLQMQLQFNRNVPAHPANLAIRYSNPGPIIIEKLTQSHSNGHIQHKGDNDVQSSRTSLPFSVVSEERLNLAVQMAKRDMKRKHLEETLKQEVAKKSQGKSSNPQMSAETVNKRLGNIAEGSRSKTQAHLKNRQQLHSEVTSSGAKVYVYTPNDSILQPAFSHSPPTHDPGPGPKLSPQRESDKSVQEVRRLQKELSKYIQKIEELAKKERSEEVLDPDEERRDRIRRQGQSVRSARILYMLQQQVKEIQEDLEKLSPRKIKHTKKSLAMSRLAAAHRAAIRALQMFVTQFNDQAEQQVPIHYKELGQLIRQLSLCSARLDKEADSYLSDTIISLLQQTENLDTLLEKKQTPKKVKKSPSRNQSRSSPARELFPDRQQSTSPRREKKAPVLKEQEPPEQTGWAVTKQLLPETQYVPVTRNLGSHLDKDQQSKHGDNMSAPSTNASLKEGGESPIQTRVLIKDAQLESEPLKNKGVLLAERPQGFRQAQKLRPNQPTVKHARFQAKTLAFRLKENRPPAKDNKIPWVSPNPTSPPASPRRVIWGKMKASPSKSFAKGDSNRNLAALQMDHKEKRQLTAAEKEAIRLAWLESETARRMDELNKLRREETDIARRIRSDLVSPIRLSPQDHLGTHVGKEKDAVHAAMLSEMLLNDVLEDTAQDLWSLERYKKLHSEAIAMQGSPDLEIMMQRVEEIERYQESVRSRFNQIVYAGPEFWANEEKEGRENASIDKRPVSPHPIRITKTVGHKDPEVSIVLERPLEGEALGEDVAAEEESEVRSDALRPLPQEVAWMNKGRTFLSIPRQMLQSVHDYCDRYQRHLRLTSHETVGGFNPWQVTESLAEDLLEGALCDVAAELQDVCEDYAEAVFTSEFLQPAT